MIKESIPISMAESLEYLGTGDKAKEISGFIKKFTKLTPKEAKEMRQKLTELNMMKVKQEHISKLIDLMPETNEEINKIFTDVSLDEDETKKLLDTIKEFK